MLSFINVRIGFRIKFESSNRTRVLCIFLFLTSTIYIHLIKIFVCCFANQTKWSNDKIQNIFRNKNYFLLDLQTQNTVYEIVSDMSSRQDAVEERLSSLEDKMQALQVKFKIYFFILN